MEEDRQDTVDEGLATDEDAQEEQVDDTEESSDSAEEEQDAEAEERLLAGKYKSPEELEKGYKELESFVGSRKELEEKARMYDRLVAQQARTAGQPVQGRPKLTSYIDKTDGTIDTARYDADMDKWEQSKDAYVSSTSSRAAQEQVDMRRLEAEQPYLLDDRVAARTIIADYRNGVYDSIYESGKAYSEYRQSLIGSAKKEGADVEKRELSKKIRGNTERSTGRKIETGEMSESKFASLSREEQKAYLDSKFQNPKFE